jgi:DNA invertase Pin-like site-specific DNA recombinase
MLKQQIKMQNKITALYCRLSQEDKFGNNGDSSSIQTQKAMLSQFAKDNGLLNCEFYVDDGESGTTFDREDFQRMMGDIEDGKVGCVITKDLSRLGRNYLEAGRHRELFAEHGVRFLAMNDDYDSAKDDGGDITVPIKEIIHEFYARDCSRKVKAAYKSKALNGGVVSGIPPYGYSRVEGTKNKLEVNPETAPIVKNMFQLALEGKTYSQIARILFNDEILTPKAYLERKGKPDGESYKFKIKYPCAWQHNSVLTILSNPIYTGKIVCMRIANKSFKDRKKIARPKEDWIITENAHEALVSQEDFDTVQERMKSKQRPPRPQNNRNIFRGLLFCNDCKRSLSYSQLKNDGSFRCTANIRCGKGMCSSHHISLTRLISIVLKDIQKHAWFAADNAKKYAEYLMQVSESDTNGKKATLQKETAKSKRRLDEIDMLIQKLYEDMTFGVITQKRFISMSAKLETEQSELEKRYTELTEFLNKSADRTRNADSFSEMMRQYTDITELDSELVHTLIEKIIVHETQEIDSEKCKRVEIFYRLVGNVDGNDRLVFKPYEKLAEVS